MSAPSSQAAEERMLFQFHDVVQAVLAERVYQIRRWSRINPEGELSEVGHEVGGFITLLQEQLDKARSAWCSSATDHEALHRMRNIAAIAFACMEQHGVIKRGFALVVNARGGGVITEKEQ